MARCPLGSRLTGPFRGCSSAGFHPPGSLRLRRCRVLVLIAALPNMLFAASISETRARVKRESARQQEVKGD
jgi:hypothetical protein